jgi:hypothetical protein
MIEHADRGLDVLVAEAGEGVGAHATRHRLDLVGDRLPARCQHDDLGAAVFAFAALDQAGGLEIVEQANHRGIVHEQGRGEVLLPRRRRRAGDTDQRQPGRLGEIVGLQAKVGGAPPLAVGAGQEGAKGSPTRRGTRGHKSK